MSTAAATHPLETVAGATTGLLDYYLRDMRAIPDELFESSPMGCARSPRSMSLEVLGVNYAVAAILKGEKAMTEEEATEHFSHLKTKAEIEAELIGSVKALNGAALSLQPEDLGTPVTAPWGQTMPKAQLYTTMSYHIMYHDGQLNYFQCLHNDSDYHWHD